MTRWSGYASRAERTGRDPRGRMRRAALTAALAVALAATYRGIEVAPERRCAPYDPGDYRHSQSVEARIVASIGQVYGPYTGRCFAGTGETDVEHTVARRRPTTAASAPPRRR